jgi:hypothetical protein
MAKSLLEACLTVTLGEVPQQLGNDLGGVEAAGLLHPGTDIAHGLIKDSAHLGDRKALLLNQQVQHAAKDVASSNGNNHKASTWVRQV